MIGWNCCLLYFSWVHDIFWPKIVAVKYNVKLKLASLQLVTYPRKFNTVFSVLTKTNCRITLLPCLIVCLSYFLLFIVVMNGWQMKDFKPLNANPTNSQKHSNNSSGLARKDFKPYFQPRPLSEVLTTEMPWPTF